MRTERSAAWTWSAALAIGCGLFAGFIALRYARQIPLDQYSFRQTQTALTAYWLQRDGFGLSYETPVVGPPWAIPFEFPIYQWIVASLSTWTTVSLDATGRLVSFAFLLGCVVPVRAIVHRFTSPPLALSPLVFPTFCALLLSSPTYVYWGRAFMIETAALFFCVVAIRWFVDLLLGIERRERRRSAILFVLFMTLGILQKATTGLPILGVLAIVFVAHRVRAAPSIVAFCRSREIAVAVSCFGIPVAVGLAWTVHTDHVKLLNPFGATALTTTALRGWNLGSMAQRASLDLFRDVLWKEILAKNCGGVLGLVLLIGGLLIPSTARARTITGTSLALGILPLFVFTNLHIEHSYYQCASVVFFLFALAVVIGHVATERIAWRPLAPVVLALMVTSNLVVFFAQYAWWVRQDFTFDNSKEVALATIIRNHVPVDHQFVAFDFIWTSSLAYLSERKGFTVSYEFRGHEAMRRDPSKFMDRARLDAFVACPSSPRQVEDMLVWSQRDGRRWKVGAIDDCYVAVPEEDARNNATTIATTSTTTPCDGVQWSVATLADSDRVTMVRLRVPRRTPASYFIDFPTAAGRSRRFGMLDVSDPTKDDQPVFYSRLIESGVATGDDPVHVERLRDGRLEPCRPTTAGVQSRSWGRPGFDVGQEADAGHAEHQ